MQIFLNPVSFWITNIEEGTQNFFFKVFPTSAYFVAINLLCISKDSAIFLKQ